MKDNTKNIFIIIAIITLTFLSYINTLNNSFVYDDNTYVVENRQIRSFSNIPQTFISSYPPDSKEQGLYRPLAAISYIFDYSIWGLNPKGFHLTNLVLHTIASIIVYFLALQLIKSAWPSAVVGIVFALHPVHTEAVTWVVGRAEVMAGLFYFLSFLFYLKSGESVSFKNRFFILSNISYLFALLSKEIAMTLPILLFVYDYYFDLKQEGRGVKRKGGIIKWLIERYIFFIIITLIYIAVRYAVLGAFGPQKDLSFMPNVGLYERFLTITVVIGYYIRLLFLPFNLTVDYVFPKISFLSLPVFIYGVVLLVSIVASVLLYKRSKLLSFSILIFFIALLPVSNIIPIGELIAERFLYIPLISFGLLIGISTNYFLNRFQSRLTKGVCALLLSILIAYYSLLTINRNYDWKDALTLWKATIYAMPSSSVAHNNLGVEYSKREQYVDAIIEYKKAVEISPTYSHALTNFGDAYMKIGLIDEAIDFYKKAIKAAPDFATAYNNLGYAYFEKGLYKEALIEYKRAIELNSKDPLFYNNLGNLYASMKRFDDAVAEYKKALAIESKDTNAYNNLGLVYAQKGRFDEAEAEVRKALAIEPENPLSMKNLEYILNRGRVIVETSPLPDKKGSKLAAMGHYNLGFAYVKKGLYNEAAIETEAALKLDPKLSDAHRNLGLIYYLYLKDNKRASYHFKKLLDIAPNQPDKENINKIIKEIEGK